MLIVFVGGSCGYTINNIYQSALSILSIYYNVLFYKTENTCPVYQLLTRPVGVEFEQDSFEPSLSQQVTNSISLLLFLCKRAHTRSTRHEDNMTLVKLFRLIAAIRACEMTPETMIKTTKFQRTNKHIKAQSSVLNICYTKK